MTEPARVLLIDDDATDRALFATQLLRVGIPLLTEIADGGADGIRHLEACSCGEHPWPWLVFLDIRMPGVGGFEVLRWMREENVLGHTVVVMMTSSRVKADIVRAFQSGAHAFVRKTADGVTLRQLVRDAARFARREELLETLSRYCPTDGW